MKTTKYNIHSRFVMLVVAVMLSTMLTTITAQSHTRHLGLQTGLLYENGWDATMSVENETSSHNLWEINANIYTKWKTCENCGHVCSKSLFHYYRTWSIGAAYKPCVFRGKNSHGNFVVGGGVGSDTNKVIGQIRAGYEKSYVLKNGWQLYWQAKTELIINGKDKFRTGIGIGFKLPL